MSKLSVIFLVMLLIGQINQVMCRSIPSMDDSNTVLTESFQDTEILDLTEGQELVEQIRV